jgi:isopentenyl-diphosphate delta-isomerase
MGVIMGEQIVVTAAIILHEGKILLAQRNPGDEHGLLWEFPGGKLELNEQPPVGLQREIKEELDLDITVGEIFQVECHHSPQKTVVLLSYLCYYSGGQAKTLDCHDFCWVQPDQLQNYQYPPADHAIVARLMQKYGQPGWTWSRPEVTGQPHGSRSRRKIEHIQHFLALNNLPGTSGFADVHMVHNALPELDWDEVDLSWAAFGKRAEAPLLINAITGGTPEVEHINRSLARCARKFGIAMAVGSQTAALTDPKQCSSFQIVREEHPEGLVLANVGAHLNPEKAVRAVEMLQADALQIHLNVPQELAMAEGERKFRGWRKNIVELVQHLQVPLIIKEVGFGLSRETVAELKSLGVQHFDVGGHGGTNFIAIEESRRRLPSLGLESWGIPTVCSTVEVYTEGVPGELIATGGISTPLDGVKALALGATAFGVVGEFLRTLCLHSEADLIKTLERWLASLKLLYVICGARDTQAIRQHPLIITGKSREWLQQRGINLSAYANRPSCASRPVKG